jgi:hypothetical protein
MPAPIPDRPVPALRPTLVVHRGFMQAFLAAPRPCCALGLVEERGRPYGLLALRLDAPLPPAVTNAGFRFGHSLLGTAAFEVLHFAFAFSGFRTYNVLVNPNNPLVQTVLTMILDQGAYFFFALTAEGSVITFRADLGQEALAGLRTHRARLAHSRTTDAQYRHAVTTFAQHPDPAGTLLQWVCHETVAYLDLTTDRLALTPM